ncbi:MAG: Rpn family recombination-promoting nuclease/putative transposase [Bacillota bacterium]
MSEEQEKDWKKLTIANHFIFSKVMRDTKICKEVLCRLLPHMEIKDVKIVEYEKVMDVSLETKAVRLDIYLNDGNTIYNLEMQASDIDDLGRRSRFYQAHIDMDCLAKGEVYHTLKDSFVIFICKFDLFKEGLPVYTFTNLCNENPKIQLKDGATKIFFNTTSHAMVKDEKMAEFLRFVNRKWEDGFSTEDEFIKSLMDKVESIKQNEDWEREYMTMNATLSHERYLGEMKKATEMAKKMLKKNKPIEEIIEFTELPQSKIEELKEELSVNV